MSADIPPEYPALVIQSALEWRGMETSLAQTCAQEAMAAIMSGAARAGLLFQKCESPAERQFLLGVFLCGDHVSVEFEKDLESLKITSKRSGAVVYLSAQIEIDDPEFYCEEHDDPCDCAKPFARVDFMVSSIAEGASFRIAIEIDGHEFHEKTKEQARADKSRDRNIVGHPWAHIETVLRFTGSEVFENHSQCARDAISVAFVRQVNRRREINHAVQSALEALTAPQAKQLSEAAE